MRSDLRKRLEALEQRHRPPPRVIREDDLLRDDPDVISADALLDQAEADMMADRDNPALRSHWLDMAARADAAKQRAFDRKQGALPPGSIVLSSRYQPSSH